MVTASRRWQNTCKVLAGADTLLLRGDAPSRASILQALLRTDRDISLRPWGRRCLADHHLRTWCPPNKPPRLSSGSGNPGSNPGGAIHPLHDRWFELAATLRADPYCRCARSERLAPFADVLTSGATEGLTR